MGRPGAGKGNLARLVKTVKSKADALTDKITLGADRDARLEIWEWRQAAKACEVRECHAETVINYVKEKLDKAALREGLRCQQMMGEELQANADRCARQLCESNEENAALSAELENALQSRASHGR